MEVYDLRGAKELGQELSQLKRTYSARALENDATRSLIAKAEPRARRDAVGQGTTSGNSALRG